MKKLLTLIVAFFVLSFGFAGSAYADWYVAEVTEEAMGDPVAGVSVTFDFPDGEQYTETGANGIARTEYCGTQDCFTISIYKEGWSPVHPESGVIDGDTHTHHYDFTMERD
jgi:hypothetical protein